MPRKFEEIPDFRDCHLGPGLEILHGGNCLLVTMAVDSTVYALYHFIPQHSELRKYAYSLQVTVR